MILVTGATGNVGRPLLRGFAANGLPVRALVREPRRLGDDRMLAAVAIGDLADPRSLRSAVRGVDTIVHLAASMRDQPGGTIERLNGLATYELLQAAQDAGVRRFVFFSALGAHENSPSRFMRAKTMAQRGVLDSRLETVVVKPSIVLSPADQWISLLRRMATAPIVPIPGRGKAEFQPLVADDVAAAVVALLKSEVWDQSRRVLEFAGPERITHLDLVKRVLAASGASRPILPVPLEVVRRSLGLVERLNGPDAFATWDEAQLLDIPMTSATGTADLESLGVTPSKIDRTLAD